jgi:hypothetical protein
VDQVREREFLVGNQTYILKRYVLYTHIPGQVLVFAEDYLVHVEFRAELSKALCENGLVYGQTATPGNYLFSDVCGPVTERLAFFRVAPSRPLRSLA